MFMVLAAVCILNTLGLHHLHYAHSYKILCHIYVIVKRVIPNTDNKISELCSLSAAFKQKQW